jgi:hypothetical protein
MRLILIVLSSFVGLVWLRRLGPEVNRRNFVSLAVAWTLAILPLTLSIVIFLMISAWGTMLGDHWPKDFYAYVAGITLLVSIAGIVLIVRRPADQPYEGRIRAKRTGIVLLAWGASGLISVIVANLYLAGLILQ